MLAVRYAAIAAALILPMLTPVCAEPASADPGFQPVDGRIAHGATLAEFRLAGVNCSLAAKGRRAAVDTNFNRDELLTARAMSKFLSGYPQPPLMVVEMHLWF